MSWSKTIYLIYQIENLNKETRKSINKIHNKYINNRLQILIDYRI